MLWANDIWLSGRVARPAGSVLLWEIENAAFTVKDACRRPRQLPPPNTKKSFKLCLKFSRVRFIVHLCRRHGALLWLQNWKFMVFFYNGAATTEGGRELEVSRKKRRQKQSAKVAVVGCKRRPGLLWIGHRRHHDVLKISFFKL